MTESPQPGRPGHGPGGDQGGFPPPPGEAGWPPPGQAQYAPGQYGQSQYGTGPYGPGQSPGPPPRKSRTGLWIGLGAGVVALVAIIVVSIVVAPQLVANLVHGNDQAPSSSAPAPTSSAVPSTEASSLPGAVTVPAERTPMPRRSTPLPDPTTCTYAPATESPAPKPASPPPNGPVPATGTVGVTLKTTAGDIGLTLDRALAPCAVASFVSLAKQGFYNGTMCHRLGTTGLQILQCGDPAAVGDPNTDGQGGPGYTIVDEVFPELTYGRGVLAMAKTAQPDSGGSQFFLVYGEAPLPPDYSVFGSVSDEGLQVLDTVARGGVQPGAVAVDRTGPPKIPVRFTGVVVSG